MGLPTVLFFQEGVFDQYDYWAGTVVLVVFALAESILFGWIFGIDKGWDEINQGADITLPKIYKPILKYITPTMLLIIFIGSLVLPKNNDWEKAFKEEWVFDETNSIIGQINNSDIKQNRDWFSTVYESPTDGIVKDVIPGEEGILPLIVIGELPKSPLISTDELKPIPTIKQIELNNTDDIINVKPGQTIQAGMPIASGWHINPIFYRGFARLMLIGLFVYLALLVRIANKKRKSNV